MVTAFLNVVLPVGGTIVDLPASQHLALGVKTLPVWVSDGGATSVAPSLEASSLEIHFGLGQWRWWRCACAVSAALC
jgi:hypothetical protein